MVFCRATSGLILLAMAGLALAEGEAPKTVDAHARLAFDGVYRRGWVPVIVEGLQNFTDQDVEVEARIEWSPFPAGWVQYPTASAWFTLPRRMGLESRKRALLYLYAPYKGQTFNLSLRKRGDEKPTVVQEIDAAYNEGVGIIIVSGRNAAAPLLRAAAWSKGGSNQGLRYRLPCVMSCDVESMPDRWIGWSQTDLVVLADLAWDKVDDRAWEALVEWVKSGGTVLLSPKMDTVWFRDPHLKELCDLGNVRIEDARRLPPMYDPGKPVACARIGSDGSEFVVHRQVEFGQVYVIPFDITTEPFLRWKGFLGMCDPLIADMTLSNPNDLMDQHGWMTKEGMRYRYSSPRFGDHMQMALRRGVRKLPSSRWLSAGILLFVLVVGPMNFLVLKRMRRPLWATVTIPCVSVAFAALVVGYGYRLKGPGDAVQHVAMVHLTSGHDFAVERRLACVCAATPGDFQIALDAAEAPRVVDPSTTGYTLAQTGPMAIDRFSLGQWEEGYLRSDSVRQLHGTIEVTHAGDLSIVANRTGRLIRRAVWVDFQWNLPNRAPGAPWKYADLGGIGPGQVAKAKGPPTTIAAWDGDVMLPRALGLTGFDDAVMWCLLEQEYSAREEGPVLLALVDGDDVPFTLAGRKPREAGTLTVLVVHQQ